jgi:KUP system potassium uptake protein
MSDSAPHSKKLLFLSLGALGVVFGDIGTSPLYTVNEIFFGKNQISHSPANIFGCIGLIIWAITIIISLKYILLVLRADNEGEGGVFALKGLLEQIKVRRKSLIPFIGILLVFAAGLLLGDGIITPAISVLSAVEGIKIATPVLTPYIIPITILLLLGLFSIQKYGTAKVGIVFGPILCLWFLTIGILGFFQIRETPAILNALNPKYIGIFLANSNMTVLLFVLGSVILAVTGGEALFADLGHFGRSPIRLSWFALVYPMLILNYLGQGAYVLSGKLVHDGNIFFSLVPAAAIVPMVILATLSTIIASQALISGAFSLTTQAIALDLLPRLKIIQTHHDFEGQRYVPLINGLLGIGSIILVLIFQSSTNLASAYGLAVAGDMFITSLGILSIAAMIWHWKKIYLLLVFIPLLSIDLTFLIANSVKFAEGGFIPVTIAVVIFTLMVIWRWGKSILTKSIDRYPTMTIKELIAYKNHRTNFIPRTIIIMTPEPITDENDRIPTLEQLCIERYGLPPKNIIFLTAVTHHAPYMRQNRYQIHYFSDVLNVGKIVSVTMNFGYMENPDVEKYLVGLAAHQEINISEHPRNWLINILDDRMYVSSNVSGIKKIAIQLFKFMHRNSERALRYFGLGNIAGLSMEVFPVKISK